MLLGGGICGAFVVFGLLSVALYKPWRSYIDHLRQNRTQQNPEDVDMEDHAEHRSRGVIQEDLIETELL